MTIQSVKRAIDILSLFSFSQPALGIAEISRMMQLPKPTVHGLVQTLHQEGLLNQDAETRKYSIGLKVVELGALLAGNLKINQIASELVQRLALNTQQNARIAIWNNNTMLITLNLFPAVEFPQFQQIGPRVPAYCTGIGKAVLSTLTETEMDEYLQQTPLFCFTQETITDREQLIQSLKEIKECGYATEKGEFLSGMGSVAVPVYDLSGKAVGAISLSGTPDILLEKLHPDLASQLIRTGIEVSRRMGYRPETLPFHIKPD
ncbi:IclR family transcriptional regulator [bacterium]|nr:IclR family transcriptional regulator [bacterium]